MYGIKADPKNASSKYIGVTRQKNKGKKGFNFYWIARIKYEGKTQHIGSFHYSPEGEKKAAKAYNEKCVELYGENAKINKL